MPKVLLRPENIPAELKALPQWVVHKSKVPHSPLTGRHASANKPETWASYEDAIKAYEAGGYSGIGFELNNNGLVGLDIDHCMDPKTGEPSALAREIVDSLDSYTEYSPSGLGLRIFVFGDISADGRKDSRAGLEIYKASRYLTITGNVFEGVKTIANRPGEILALYEKHFDIDVDPAEPETDESEDPDDFADVVLIERAKKAENGEKFAKLYSGDWQGDYSSQSEADQAFCNLLAFWTSKDKAQMDRIFRESGLMREKWERTDYAKWTINKAVRDCKQVFGEDKPALKPDALKTISAKDLQDKNIPPVQWVVQNMLPQGLSILVAKPKLGKSWLALDLCLSVVRGQPFLGMPTRKCEALYLALEDSERRLKERQEKLLIFGEQAPEGLYFSTSINPIGDGFDEQLNAYINRSPNLRLIIVDTLQTIRNNTGAKNVYAQDYKDLRVLKQIADQHNLALMVVHHAPKSASDSDPLSLVSGSFGIAGAVDTTFVLTKQKRQENRGGLFITGRDVEMRDLVIDFDSSLCKWKYSGEAESQGEKDHRQDPVVVTIRDLTAFGAWQGTTSELQAEIEKRTSVLIESRELGRAVIKLIPALLEYDNINYSWTNPQNRKTHRFSPTFFEDENPQAKEDFDELLL